MVPGKEDADVLSLAIASLQTNKSTKENPSIASSQYQTLEIDEEDSEEELQGEKMMEAFKQLHEVHVNNVQKDNG